MFKPVNPNPNFPQLEDERIQKWQDDKTFEESVTSRPVDKTWTFLDGPPFITGMPHYGTLLPSILKDVYPRYWTMKGYRVRRVWGWDCHGLPAENKVESKLGIKRKKDIEETVGVKKFIDECKSYVNQVSSEWQWYIDHIARWVDFKHAYKTMDTPYMESVMWVFKQMYDRGHIYKGLRVSLYCPHCSTPISNFEVAMDADNYKDIQDTANTYKYPLADSPDTFFLAWSTTPWNKVVTPALAINPELEYVTVRQNNEKYILAKSRLAMLTDAPYEIEATYPGTELVGKKFVPHFDFYKIDADKHAFEVIGGDFVTSEEGTGIVTIAAYGEEDLAAMKANNIQIYLHVDDEGHFKAEVPEWGGMYYLDANALVNENLARRGLMYKEETLTHSVPTCWRCHTRLYYAPQNAWYVNVQDLKPVMGQTNEMVNWYPDHFKHGRFANSMKSAPDWCISRSRYWGSPVPVWECECGWRFVPGSLAELSQKSGQTVTELHKPEIDEVVITCDNCHKQAHRVLEVLDSWIEAGSASFAERHYPFDTTHKLSDFFPPDFIVEYTGQIRAWFYVLHVIAAALYGTPAFKNVAVTGVILGTDGRKMSKNYGNYPDPKELLQKYGGDALRLYLAGNAVTKGEDMIISEDDYKLQIRSTLLILWNCFNYFVTYANMHNFETSTPVNSSNVLDTWLNALTRQLGADLEQAYEKYDSTVAVDKIKKYVDELSTWYIRRSRDRVQASAENRADTMAFFGTLHTNLLLFCRLAAPIIPFITDEIYTHLTNEKSVHLADWPHLEIDTSDSAALSHMQATRKLVEQGLAARKVTNIKVRQPLASVTLTQPPYELSTAHQNLIKAELNVKQITFSSNTEATFDTNLTPELKSEGEMREYIRQIQDQRKDLGARLDQHIVVTIPSHLPDHYLTQLSRQTLADSIQVGGQLHVDLV